VNHEPNSTISPSKTTTAIHPSTTTSGELFIVFDSSLHFDCGENHATSR
jgi:hypothetical protein